MTTDTSAALNNQKNKKNKNEKYEKSRAKFIKALFTDRAENKGFAAKIRRASHPSRKQAIWPLLPHPGITVPPQAQAPYILIASAIASGKQTENGSQPFIRALARAWPDKDHQDENHPAIMRLHRLLACTDTAELCHILRPILSLIQSRTEQANLDYLTLLNDLTRFRYSPQAIKSQWMTLFYSSGDEKAAQTPPQDQPQSTPTSSRQARINELIKFTDDVFDRCKKDQGFAAQMRRACHPATEQNSWPLLIRHNINITHDDRLPYILIASAIASGKQTQNGKMLFMPALAHAWPDKNNNNAADMRLRRLLACSDTAELCQLVRQGLSIIQSRLNASLNYVALLDDLTAFHRYSHQIKTRWAKQFYLTDETENARHILDHQEKTEEEK